MIIPGITASAHGNTGTGGTGSPSNLPPPADYVGSTFTSSSNQIMSLNGYVSIPGGAPAVPASPIVASWAPSTTTNVTGYLVTVTYLSGGSLQTYQFAPTGSSISWVPPSLSDTSSYTVSVAAVTTNGVTGQPSTQVINTTFGYGSTESSNTSANTSPISSSGTYINSQISSQAIQSSLTGYTPNLGPAPK